MATSSLLRPKVARAVKVQITQQKHHCSSVNVHLGNGITNPNSNSFSVITSFILLTLLFFSYVLHSNRVIGQILNKNDNCHDHNDVT